MIRVGFPLIGGRGWTGGYNYLLNLIRAAQTYAPGRIAPVVFVGAEAAAGVREDLHAVDGVEVVIDPAFGETGKTGRLAGALAFGLDRAAQKAFRKHRIDVVFEAAQFYGWRLPQPAIAWIPDFQHRRLPHLFSTFARFRRAAGFNAQVWSGRRIMLSSEDARADCELFHAASTGKTAVVRFAIPRDHPVDAVGARAVADRYGLPETYFYLPNQFWVHKNHAAVIEALAILKARGRPVVVAASGNQSDPRDPGHFQKLAARANEAGVTDLFRPLGLIPYAEVPLLMRASTAMINPSLFEGWSTTVEEARSTGTPMILSDLRVHREQAGEAAVYFDPERPDALADIVAEFRPRSTVERNALAADAAARSRQRAAEFGERFADLVSQVARAEDPRRRDGR